MIDRIGKSTLPAQNIVEGAHFFAVRPKRGAEFKRVEESILGSGAFFSSGKFRFSLFIQAGQPFEEEFIEDFAPHVPRGIMGVQRRRSPFLETKAKHSGRGPLFQEGFGLVRSWVDQAEEMGVSKRDLRMRA